MTRLTSYGEAIREATIHEMERDPGVFVIGQGVADHKGMYGTVTGLAERFGKDRVVESPLSEDGIAGVAIGAAMAGMRPIHTHIRMDFALLSINQLVNIAAKAHYMYGGQVSVPLVVRAIIGRSWGQGAQHSQGLHSFFAHVPGLKVVAPTTPYDAKGTFARSIRDDDPVIFVEHRMLHKLEGHVPEEPYEVAFGKARVLREGRDVTLVGISHAAVDCLRASRLLADVGIEAEVIDPVTLRPLDMDTIAGSVRRTGHLVVVDAAWTFCGMSAEIAAQTGEFLDGHPFRFRRIGFAPVSCPTTRCLEDLFYPDARRIAVEVHGLLRRDGREWTPPRVETPEIAEFKGPF